MKRSPALERARQYLTALASRMRERGDRQLPSYRELAARAEVSTVTVWKCLRELAATGLLERGSGRWRVAAGSAREGVREERRVAGSAGPAWKRVCDRVRSDIELGALGAGNHLPGGKELCARYGAAPATVRKAVRHLTELRIVQPYGRWYRVPAQAATPAGSSLFLVAFGCGQIEMGTPRTRDNLRAAELLCSRHGLRLRIVPVASGAHASLEPLREQLRRWPRSVGAMFWDMGLNTGTLVEAVDFVNGAGLPVALLCETDEIAAGLQHRRSVQPFVSGSSLADGAAVGRFLLARGHRRVAYVSPDAGAVYSTRRRNGLIDAFEQVGAHGAVVVFEEQRTVDGASLSIVARREIQNIYEHYGNLEYAAFREMVRRRLNAPQLQGLFETVAADPAVSAWVCNNDTTAVEALRFLRSRDIAVPGTIAVVGYDDSLEAFVEGLSSYSFDPTGLAQAMLNFVLTFDRRGKPLRRAPVTLEGFVNERLTT